MKLFNRVLVDPAVLSELQIASYGYERLLASEKDRHSRDKHAKLEAIIAKRGEELNDIYDKNQSLEIEREDLGSELGSYQRREAKLLEREANVTAREAGLSLAIEAAAAKATADAVTKNNKDQREVMNGILTHGKFLELPAPTNNFSGAMSPGGTRAF